MSQEITLDKNKYVTQIKNLILKVVKDRKSLTPEQKADIRLDISTLRFLIVEELMGIISNRASHAELDAEDVFTTEFGKYYNHYVSEKDETGKNKHTRSSAESFARNTCKLKELKTKDGKRIPGKYYEASRIAAEARNEEKKLFQLLKSIEQVTNSLSTMTK